MTFSTLREHYCNETHRLSKKSFKQKSIGTDITIAGHSTKWSFTTYIFLQYIFKGNFENGRGTFIGI
jgi:hypothetical protein